MISHPTLPFVPSAIAFGHLVAYAVAHPEPAARADALAGHAHLPLLLAVGVLSGLFGLASLVRARSDDRRLAPSYLNLMQLGALGFWALEAVEHLQHGGLGTLASEPTLWWGVGFQTAIAGFIVGLARSASRLGARCVPAHPARSVSVAQRPRWFVHRQHTLVDAARTSPNRRRGPPLLNA